MHQNDYCSQRQYYKEHCKYYYHHDLEPSAAIAFRSAQHNRLSALKLAILFGTKTAIRRHTDISRSPASDRWPLPIQTQLTPVIPGSSSMRGRSSRSSSFAMSFASLILHHQRNHPAHYQHRNDHCNKSDGKHLILLACSGRREPRPQRSPILQRLPTNVRCHLTHLR